MNRDQRQERAYHLYHGGVETPHTDANPLEFWTNPNLWRVDGSPTTAAIYQGVRAVCGKIPD